MPGKDEAGRPFLVLGAGAALVVFALCLPRPRRAPVAARPGEIVAGMDQAQVRASAGEPLQTRTMQDKAWDARMDAWTYPDRRVFFFGGYVRTVVPLSGADR